MTAHLDDATLDALLQGRLSAAALVPVDTHLDACADCRARLGSLARSGHTVVPQAIETLAPAKAQDPYVGTTIAGRYYVHRLLGGGGMGNVYEAEHTLIARRVAIKVLLPQWATHQEVVRRFQNEARAAGSLRHPGILSALDMGRTEQGTPFVVLELLEGADLEAHVESRGPLPVEEAVQIGLRVAEALSVAHAAGIVHRDLKPENVFCTSDGGIKVLDFGISKITGALATGPATAPGSVMGTPMYMAPEQFEDAAKADPRTDVYALGVLLYRCLTGALPHVADSLPALLMAVVAGEAKPLRAHVPRLPAALDDAVLRALRPLPGDRWPSMERFAQALAPFADPAAARAADDGDTDSLELDIDVETQAERSIAAILAVHEPRDPARTRQVVEAHGGVVVAHEAGLLGVFGGRSWHGDEPVRAVRAGLAVRPEAEAVAVAAGRIEWVDGEVLGDRTAPAPSSPLLGRSEAIAQIDATLARVRSHRAGSVLRIDGAVGMGKSRLIAEAASRAREAGFLVFTARADPHTGLSTLEFAHQLARAVPLAAAALRAELAGTTPAPARANPSVMADRLELSLRATLEALASYGPLALFVDDLQWSDAALRAFLQRAFADLLAAHSAVLVCASRAAEVPFDADAALHLAPLTRDELAAWAAGALGAPLAEDRLDALLSLTEGNPQFVEQTLAAVAAAGTSSEIPLPIDVEAAVEARLGGLPPSARALLEAATVCFDRFDASTLTALGVTDATHDRLRALEAEGWLRRASAEAGFELGSALLAEVLYRALPEARRAKLHLAIATHLAGRSGADREWVAWHFDRAGERAEAAREFARVALEAATRGDGARALRASDRALALGVDEGSAFALHMARAATLERAGDLEAQGSALEAARSLATTPEERTRVLAAAAVRTLRRRGPREAQPAFDAELDEAKRADDPLLEARAHGALAMALVALGSLEEARGALARAEELIATRAPSLVANLAGWHAQLAAAQGDLGARRTAFARARRLHLEQGDVRSAAGVAVNLGDALTRFGAYEEAIAALSEARERCRALGIRLMEGYALANLGRALACVGRPDAGPVLTEAAELAAQSGDRHLAAWVALYRALAAPDADATRDAAHLAYERARESDLGAAMIGARVLEARAALALGQTAAARARVDEALEVRAGLEALEEGEADLFEVRIAVLEAESDAEGAAEVLARARAWLRAAAAGIADATMRERFVRDVPVHARLEAGVVRAFPA